MFRVFRILSFFAIPNINADICLLEHKKNLFSFYNLVTSTTI